MIIRVILFLLINFAALGIGSIYTNAGVTSDWYTGLNKAPWTPPGWVFGAAWSLIMICFAFYMAYAWKRVRNRQSLIILFVLQWVLNVAWNPVFFKFHLVTNGLIIISALTILTGIFLLKYRKELRTAVLFVLPYFLWLLIATSLNAFILFNN